MKPKEPLKPAILLAALAPWALPALAAATVAAAVWSYARTTHAHAGGDSPYYDKAVKEAMAGLANPGDAAATPQGQPPLPAGLSPADYYWCDQHKQYHKREAAAPAQGQPAAVPAGAARPAPAVPQAHAAIEIPPLLAGQSPLDYVWCGACKGFHRRPTPAAQPAAQPGTQPADMIPPLPEGFDPAKYYWCPDCKAYHPRESANPVHPGSTPPPGTAR
jgi:hypothetical protein